MKFYMARAEGMENKLTPLVVCSYGDMRIKAEYEIHLGQKHWKRVCHHHSAAVVYTGCVIALSGTEEMLEGRVRLVVACLLDALIERVPVVEIPKILHDVRGLRDVSYTSCLRCV